MKVSDFFTVGVGKLYSVSRGTMLIVLLAVSGWLAFAVLLATIIGWHHVHRIDIYGNGPGVTERLLAAGWRRGRRGLVPVLFNHDR